MKNKQPKVSVIITYFNMQNYIDFALKSVFKQTYPNIEIILVDDGSPDIEAIKKLEKLQTTYKNRVLFINQKNKGLPAARNTGIKSSKGDFLCCLDADDILEPSFIEKAIESYKTNPEVSIVTSWMSTFGEYETTYQFNSTDLRDLLKENILHVSSIFKKDVWEKVGGFDENFINGFDDWEFWINAAKHDFKWMIIPEVLFNYRIRKNSMSSQIEKNTAREIGLYNRLYTKHISLFKKYALDILISKDFSISWHKGQLRILKESQPKNEENKDKQEESANIDETLEIVKTNSLILQRFNGVLNRTERYLKMFGLYILIRIVRRTRHILKYKEYPFLPKRYGQMADTGIYNRNKPLVSVIIPCFNYGAYIQEAVSSVKSQSWNNLEIIIVNDKSTEKETINILKKLKKDPGIKLLENKENSGVVYTRNRGIKEARGKYILCLDADDKLDPSYIEKCIWVFERNPQIGVVYSDLQMFGNSNDFYKFGNFDIRALMKWNQVTTAAMFRKVCWEQTGGYKEEMRYGHEDWELWLSIAEKGWEGYKIPEPLFFYRTHSKSSLSHKALEINNNLISRIKTLHTPLYSLPNPYKIRKKVFPLKSVKDNKINYDKPESKKNVVLLFVPFVIAGGAEKLWANIAQEISKSGYKILIIGTNEAEQEIYPELLENTIGIFNLKKFAAKKDWEKFIFSQIKKYSVRNVIISNNAYVYKNTKLLKALRAKDIKVMDIVYNDSAYGFLDQSIKIDRLLDRHFVNNPEIIKSYKKAGIDPQKTNFIPSCVNLKNYDYKKYNSVKLRTKFKANRDNFLITYIGRLSPEKNVESLVQAISDLRVQKSPLGKRIRLNIIGSGMQEKHLKKLAKKLSISKQVHFFPFTSKVQEFYAASDLFALVSTIDGFPLTIIESVAMGVPVLATNIGAKKNLLKHKQNGYLIESPDRFAISKALEDIYNNDYFLDRASIRESAKEYNVDKVAGILLKELK
ncbi:glycosyltransferase [Candidatus Dojkabacteria bacterium]|nr:glycosyltransferase [Candidatus Dojkabacteria bacterium]